MQRRGPGVSQQPLPEVELELGAANWMGLAKLVIAGALLVAAGATAIVVGKATAMARPGEHAEAIAVRQPAARKEPAKSAGPALPGAVTEMPSWLNERAPFDMVGFFSAPPGDENAAPRYLEALFEFGPEVEVCFPEGAERQRRKMAVEEKLGRFWPIFRSWTKDPRSITAEQIDHLLSEFDAGFHRLDLAQQIPRCVFQSGLGVTTRIPHVQSVGHVVRVTRLKVYREIERVELDAAIRDCARLLRLSRDLIARGTLVTQMVSSSTARSAVEYVMMPLLKAPGLTAEHCDQILKILEEHEKGQIDPYSQGLRGEYASVRATIHRMINDQKRLREEWNSLGNPAGRSIVAEIAEPVVTSVLEAGAEPPPVAPAGGDSLETEDARSLKSIPDLDERFARMTPELLALQIMRLNIFYAQLLRVANAPYLERMRKTEEHPRALDGHTIPVRVLRGISSSAFTAFAQSLGNSQARVRAAIGMVSVRRWQLTHAGEEPKTLEAAARDAKLETVPADPFDGAPLRYAIVDGQPTVYSIGQDGKDDGGKLDNARSPASGDVLLRLPKR
jgi:hypothetical protein